MAVMFGTTDYTPFANRLRKMDRHISKWARRQGIQCYRIYDRDVPEFPFAVDRYGDFLHVAEYQRNHDRSPEEHRNWIRGCRHTLSEVLEVDLAHIFIKERASQKGKQQYEKQSEKSKEIIVEEDGLQFYVNLSDYLDTGLFLDHRPLRKQVREESSGKRVLNLFAYTGSFTVYAAAGGATESLTLDLSNTYLDWARRNLELNELAGPHHRFEQADVKMWLREDPTEKFDIIILDPPTFSNSKRMRFVLDVQADHSYMINSCIKRLNRGGMIYFSTNFRRFKLDTESIWSQDIRDITAQTIPQDFRNKRIHYCWAIGKG